MELSSPRISLKSMLNLLRIAFSRYNSSAFLRLTSILIGESFSPFALKSNSRVALAEIENPRLLNVVFVEPSVVLFSILVVLC